MTTADADTPANQDALDLLAALGDLRIVRGSWKADGTGVQPGGVVGGDGATDAVSVRFVNRYAPNARITVSVYAIVERDLDEPGDTDPFKVQTMTEYYLADRLVTDDDAEENSSDYHYEDHDAWFTSWEDALAARDKIVLEARAEQFDWDGTAENMPPR